MSAITCKVTKLEKINDHVYIVELNAGQAFTFNAGQYLQVIMGEDDKRPFSIASLPGETSLQLHVGAMPGNSYATEVIERCQSRGELDVEVGFGEAQLREDSERPVILLAGGTGFSYIQSIALRLAEVKPRHKVLLYWGGKNRQALYASESMTAWQQAHDEFEFIPVIEQADENWQGKTGYVHLAVLNDIKDLRHYDIYAAGHFEMIKIVHDDFIAQGAVRQHMFSDAFAYIKK